MVRQNIESEIQRLLVQHEDPLIVADELLKIWDRGELSYVELNRVAFFLLNGGFFSTLVNQIKKHLTKNQRLPWAALLEVLTHFPQSLNSEIISQVLIGAAEEDALAELIFVRDLDSIDDRFAKLRQKLLTTPKDEVEKKKQELIQQADQLKIDGLHDEEQKIIEQIKILDPDDQVVAERSIDASLMKIRDLLLRKESEMFGRDLMFAEESVDPALTRSFVDCAKADPTVAYELSVSLYQMGCVQDALTALQYAPSSIAKDWLHIQLLIENKLYIQVLDELNPLEVKYAHDPETIFSALIFKAKALWGLEQKEAAIQILEKVLQEKPSYTTAQTLLRGWKAELT